MLALKIIAVLLGAAFTLFDYFIFFRKSTLTKTALRQF